MNVDDSPFRRARRARLRDVGDRINAKVLIAAIVASMLLLTVVLVLRAHQADETDSRLCGVIAGMISRSGATIGQPGTPGYAYYKDHPDELKLARAQNESFLDELGCAPNLPKGARE